MKRLIAAMLCLACGADSLPPDQVECGSEVQSLEEDKGHELTPWYNYGDRAKLWETTAKALTRVRAATCMDVDVSMDGASHFVRWAPDEEMPNDSSGYITGSDWEAQKIRIRYSKPESHWAPILTHEILHALRRSYGHACGDGSMSHPTLSASQSKITQCDLDLVCAKQDCGCQVPEAP